ncbi:MULTISPECIES: carotenoid biosynthesis protein [Bradyrhizobium]|uniref:Carotenoid biosynthesis protein n=1 Tax=Bradyrhizobium septentrionale TaxID=1404411 RepID=A0A973ZZW1_9BRAD|nr:MULTISPECIES: carotenoid biosynthesis protein [Bradyrhizobium]MCK7667815.1 carotenoid biosynthesis protein [Bradyrhizobium sp. 2S1]QIG97878.1 carotenoid biosynthesis protein [Bradyrhizobium sp. 6(2017)]UGY12334.1 carotenoid biosynthesis protein [Bradyrhizobium septentrionale]UGY25555.1 carotenoid biosynthesis protein [Bradyrhizobium septentrionale]
MTPDNVARSRHAAQQDTVLWLFVAGILAAAIGFSWNPTPFAQALAVVFIACALAHAALAYGARRALILFVACNAISFAMENLGTATGFPFGVYHFEVGAGLPHVGLIPIVVGPLWFGAGYFSWTVASVLLDGADHQLDRPFNLIALPVVAAFVMTQWDLVIDAPNATIAKVWIWHNGGGVFGVPLTNYVGWLLTSWLIFQVFALYLRRSDLRPYSKLSLKLPAIGILFYVGAGLTHIVPWVMGQTGEAVDARGYGWQVHDIREATVAILLLTMLFTALLAALRLLRRTSQK